jgi:hypothetical protein
VQHAPVLWRIAMLYEISTFVLLTPVLCAVGDLFESMESGWGSDVELLCEDISVSRERK